MSSGGWSGYVFFGLGLKDTSIKVIKYVIAKATPARIQLLRRHQGETATDSDAGEIAGNVDTNPVVIIETTPARRPTTNPKEFPLFQFGQVSSAEFSFIG